MAKKDDIEKINFLDIFTGEKPPLRSFYLVTGGDIFVFNEIDRIFREKFMKDDPQGFNYCRLDADANTKGSSIVNTCEEYPFGSRYRMTVVLNTQKMKKEEGEKIKKYLENPLPTAILVLCQDISEKNLPSSKFNAEKELKSLFVKKGLMISGSLDYKQMREWVRENFKKEGKNIDRDAVEFLITSVGENMWELKMETDKLLLYAGKRTQITQEDVQTIVSQRSTTKIFDLNESLGTKNIKKSLVILDQLLKEKIVGAQLLSTLNSHFTLIAQVCQLLEEGQKEEDIAKTLRKHPYYIKKVVAQAMKFSGKSLATLFNILARADGGIKNGMDERMVLEISFINICRLKG